MSATVACLFLPTNVTAQETLEQTQKRVDELEENLLEVEERIGSKTLMQAFDAMKFDVGGFVTQTFASIESDAGNETGFELGQFELMLKAEVTPDWSMFTLLEFKRTAGRDESNLKDVGLKAIKNKADLELYYATFRYSDALEVKTGRFVTPHGVINIEHFHPTLLHVPYPMFMRQGRTATFFDRFLVGAEASGTIFPRKGVSDSVTYSAYAASRKQTPGKFQFGGRVAYTLDAYGVTVGLNYGHGDNIDKGVGSGQTDYDFAGADLLVDYEDFLVKSEVFVSDQDKSEGRLGWYVQPAYRVTDKWTVFYRYDFLEPGQLDSTPDADQQEHVVGVNYTPSPLVRLRVAATSADYDVPDDETVESVQVSVTVSF